MVQGEKEEKKDQGSEEKMCVVGLQVCPSGSSSDHVNSFLLLPKSTFLQAEILKHSPCSSLPRRYSP